MYVYTYVYIYVCMLSLKLNLRVMDLETRHMPSKMMRGVKARFPSESPVASTIYAFTILTLNIKHVRRNHIFLEAINEPYQNFSRIFAVNLTSERHVPTLTLQLLRMTREKYSYTPLLIYILQHCLISI